jgi:hypothetical protein
MPRTLSWLDRIVPISRSVAESARSHYDRKELQRLFELQPRAAQQLMAALPHVPVGRAKLIEREALSDFLRRLNESDNPAETYARMRAEGGKTVRRKLREFSLQDYPASVDSPPRMMTIERGELRVKFQTLEELAEAMLYLATVFTHDLDGFAQRYEPAPEVPEEQARAVDEARREAAMYRDWLPTG